MEINAFVYGKVISGSTKDNWIIKFDSPEGEIVKGIKRVRIRTLRLGDKEPRIDPKRAVASALAHLVLMETCPRWGRACYARSTGSKEVPSTV